MKGQRSFLSTWTTSQGTQRQVPSISVVSNVHGALLHPKASPGKKPYLFFGGDHSEWHVELPQPGIKAVPPAVEAQSLNHWITRKSTWSVLFYLNIYSLTWLLQVSSAACGIFDCGIRTPSCRPWDLFS